MENPERLITRAFEQARDSGKLDWPRMTTAVLKNRMLALTGREFRESDYGADTFAEFVARFGDVVSLDETVRPPIVWLTETARKEVASVDADSQTNRLWVRNDLWQAVIDRSGGKTYIWDSETLKARPGEATESNPIMPTIDEDVDRGWRSGFRDSLVADSDEIEQTLAWAENLLPPYHLPRHLTPRWHGFLTRQVHQRLVDWFQAEGVAPPPDFVSDVSERPRHVADDSEALRRLALRTVRAMTEEELSQLNLPLSAVLRAMRSK